MLKRFKYTKENGDKSSRTVFSLMGDTERLFCVDLSEFDSDELDQYVELLDEIHNNYIDAIKEIGLGSTFRTFLTKRMN